jgi:O-Antigen ligase
MRRVVPSAAGALLLAGPTAIAFFSGGYFDGPRATAGVVAWLLVAVAAATGLRLTGGGPGPRLALAGLAGLAAWTLLSILWAPIAGNAYHAGQIAVLYLGTMLAAALLLRGARARRLIEPALAAGTLIVIGYGLSERLLPGLLHFARSVSAQGRLEQPLTYWNAMGELAAIGFTLCARIAGDGSRRVWERCAALAATAPLGLGVYISFSRGALFACLAGLVALIVLAPRTEQLAAALLSVLTGTLAAVAAAFFHGVTGLAGSLGDRERQGAIVLALLVVIAAAGAVGQWLLARRVGERTLGLPRRAPLLAGTLICAGLALAIVVGAKESGVTARPLASGATRLVSLQSNRYAYWDVALRAFGTEPLRGVGAGGWSVYWLRWRTIGEFAQDAHSLPLQTLAELGLVGIALLATFLAGVWLGARRALRGSRAAVGPAAAFVVYIAHAPLDWDWQMPAVTLVAMVLAGVLLAGAEREPAFRAAVSPGSAGNKMAPVNLAP